MMQLYTYFRSSAAYRVRIALNLKGLAYDSLPVNLIKGDQSKGEYLALNPQGRVPALVVDGATLIQSPAILEYLDETHPTPPLLPSSALARAEVRAACALIACDIHPLNNIGVLRYLKRQLGHDQPTIDAWYRHWVVEGLAALERLVKPGPFAFGPQPTLADVYLVPQVYNARRRRNANPTRLDGRGRTGDGRDWRLAKREPHDPFARTGGHEPRLGPDLRLGLVLLPARRAGRADRCRHRMVPALDRCGRFHRLAHRRLDRPPGRTRHPGARRRSCDDGRLYRPRGGAGGRPPRCRCIFSPGW
jgi:maleylacetoacetate isomerase